MSSKIPKVTWSIKVPPKLREWFEGYAEERLSDPAEEARRALVEYRERAELSKHPDQNPEED